MGTQTHSHTLAQTYTYTHTDTHTLSTHTCSHTPLLTHVHFHRHTLTKTFILKQTLHQRDAPRFTCWDILVSVSLNDHVYAYVLSSGRKGSITGSRGKVVPAPRQGLPSCFPQWPSPRTLPVTGDETSRLTRVSVHTHGLHGMLPVLETLPFLTAFQSQQVFSYLSVTVSFETFFIVY